MSTYAIGDVQGCTEQLEALLELIQFDPASDRLWFAGDLVNRGPDSLGTLRLIYSIRDSVTVVLGNHDLHMLAVDADKRCGNKKDNFSAVFEADDKEQLLEWLRFCPLIHREKDYLMVHAGIHPDWDKDTSMALASEVENILRSDDNIAFFRQMYGNKPESWSPELSGNDRLRFITNVLTRMRYCYADKRMDLLFKGPVSKAPADLIPWFSVPGRIKQKGYILHGHWASLEDTQQPSRIVSLDTGCVWGNKLSAWCLEDKRWFSVPGYNTI